MADARDPKAADSAPEAANIFEPEGFGKRLYSYIRKPENLTLIGAASLFVVFLWIGSDVIERSKTLKEALHDFLSNAFKPPATGEIEFWFVLLAVGLGGVLFVAVLYSMGTFVATRSLRRNHSKMQTSESELRQRYEGARSERDRMGGALSQLEDERNALRAALQDERQHTQAIQTAHKDERQVAQAVLAKQTERLEAYVGETIRAVSKIGRQLFLPSGSTKGKTIRSALITFHISRNFDAEVHRRYVIRAGDVPLHFWQSSIDASGDAQPIAAFTDIGYQLITRNPGKDVVYLPAENDGFNKSALIFFLPLIRPGEEREIEVVYRWPGLFLGMQKVGWEDFNFSFKSAETMESFELEVFLEDGSGGHLNFAEVGVPLPERSIHAVTNDRGWQGWRYAGKNIQPHILADEIVARLEWKRS